MYLGIWFLFFLSLSPLIWAEHSELLCCHLRWPGRRPGFMRELVQVCVVSATCLWRFFWNMWATKYGAVHVESGNLNGFGRKNMWGPTSSIPVWKNILSVTRWIISSEKKQSHFKDSNKKSQCEPQTYVILLCLSNKKLFPAAPKILLWKRFLSPGLPLFMSSTVNGSGLWRRTVSCPW